MNKKKRVEYELAAKLLDMASDEFSNHGCNDFELPNTPENYALVESMELWNVSESGEEPNEVNVSEDGQTIYTMDWYIMSYLAHCLREAGK